MKIPARCNKRSCQARRNLSKRPEEYVNWPTCNKQGCNGKMYVDEYRLKKGLKDKVPVCRDQRCGYMHPGKKSKSTIHRISTPGCIQHDEYKLNIAARGPVKNSPFPFGDVADEAPF